MPTLAAIILAAGSSSRLGRPKQLLIYEGVTFLRRAIQTAEAAGCSPIVVVLGCGAESMEPELAGTSARAVFNADWERGMGTSIRRSVEALLSDTPDLDRVVLMLCDQPLVTAATITRLDDLQKQTGSPVVVAEFDGSIGPPVLVTGAFVQSLLTVPDDRGAKAIWASHSNALLEVVCPEAAFDVDTAEQWEHLSRDGRRH